MTRWRPKNPGGTTKNVRKKARSSGCAFVDEKGRNKAAKSTQPFQHEHKKPSSFCCDQITEEMRQSFFNDYWKNCTDFKSKKNFLLTFTKKDQCKRRRVEVDDNPRNSVRKTVSFKYFMPINNEHVPVCREFFTKTLNISYYPITTAHKNKSANDLFVGEEPRGRHSPHNKKSVTTIQKIKSHIESFPAIESHYCRASSQRQYLDADLSIAKMHELYMSNCESAHKVSKQKYQEVFCTQYNLAFHQPKKDQCSDCSTYKTITDDHPEKAELDANFQAHIFRKETSRAAMKNDVAQLQNDEQLCVVTMDLQVSIFD